MGRWRSRCVAIGAGIVLLGQAQSGQPGTCKLALALALDISSSVNQREYEIQLQGLARAFRTPEVIEAILTPEGVGIAVIVYEWSGYNQQDIVVPWTLLDNEAVIRDVATTLATHRRPYSDLTTALGKSVEYGAMMFSRAPPCARRVIDISGDGENNDGAGPEFYRAQGKLNGITINGLVVEGAVPDPVAYYSNHVIQGPGAFVARARDFDDYPSVMIGKLLREIDQEMITGDLR